MPRVGICLVLVVLAVACGRAGAALADTKQMGSYSTYHALPASLRRTPDGSEAELQGCSLVQLQYVSRHGSRFPFDHMVEKYRARGRLMRDLAARPGARMPPWMHTWSIDDLISNPTAGDLHERGEEELYDAAQRLKLAHPEVGHLLHFGGVQARGSHRPGTFNANQFRVHSSQYIHTARSAEALAYGFLEGEGDLGTCGYQPIYVDNMPLSARRLTAYNELKGQCPTVRTMEDAMEDELDAKEVLLGPIARRLSAEWASGHNLTASDVNHFFSLCAFEMELVGRTDQFCSLFSQAERDKWQLYVDIDAYHSLGPGFPPIVDSASLLLRDIYAGMAGALKRSPTAPRLFLHVGHRQTMLTLAALLGLFDGQPPSFTSRPGDYPWRVSDIAPFAANAAFLLYDCAAQMPGGRQMDAQDTHFVRLLYNEHDVDLPHAPASVAMSYKAFWQRYKALLTQDLDGICVKHTGQHVEPTALASPMPPAKVERQAEREMPDRRPQVEQVEEVCSSLNVYEGLFGFVLGGLVTWVAGRLLHGMKRRRR